MKRSCMFVLVLTIITTSAVVGNAQKYRYFGTQYSDWSIFTFPTAGGTIRWRILKNENPSQPPGIIYDIPFGESATELVPNQGDYTGDGIDDFAFYRDNTGTPANTYIIGKSGNAGVDYFQWGNAAIDSVGAEGDYDGDHKMDYTVVRATSTTSPLVWWILRSSNSTIANFIYGNNATDIALPGADYTGDGTDDPAVARIAGSGAITWIPGNISGTPISQLTWGNFNTDFIIPAGDYDGDHKADYMVWRGFGSVNGHWYLMTSQGVYADVAFGIPGASGVRDTALRSGDYDGDGKTDIAVYRGSNSTFYVLRSSGFGAQSQSWGIAGNTNIPIASFGTF